MLRRGISVVLGIDQSNICDDRDMMVEMKLVWALHRETGMWNDRLDAVQILRMATEHGAHSVGFAGIVGHLEPGQRADIVLMSREAVGRPLVNPRTPIADAILHRAGKQSIDKVFVDGRLVVDGGRVIAIDRDAAMKEIADRLALPETPTEMEAWKMVDVLVARLEDFHRRHPLVDASRSYRDAAMDEG